MLRNALGEVGKIDTILYNCLVTGFNSKSVSSISVSNNLATVITSTSHGYNEYDIISISGANESVFNDEFTISSVPSSTTFTFSLTTGLTSATGTISCKIAPLGWTRVFTGTNKSVYRSSEITSTQIYLRVDDTSTYYTQVNMYENMSSVDAGTNKGFDIWWIKSNLNTSATRGWTLVGDSKRFYLMTNYSASYSGLWSLYVFGDIIPFRTNDPWCCILAGHSASSSYSSFPSSNTGMHVCNGTSNGMYIARHSSWIGNNSNFSLLSLPHYTLAHGYGTIASFPSPANNAINLYATYVIDESFDIEVHRGILPGFYTSGEITNGYFAVKNRTLLNNDKTYMAFKSSYSTSYTGNYWLDITGPWT